MLTGQRRERTIQHTYFYETPRVNKFVGRSDALQFKEYFYMTKNQLDILCSSLGSRLCESGSKHVRAVGLREKVVLTLNVLCNGGKFRQSAADWQRSRSTVHEVFYETVQAVVDTLYPVFVRFPVGDDAGRSQRAF